MVKIIGCVIHQHDLRLVGLAAFICFLSCLTASALLSRAKAAKGLLRTTWIAIAGLEFGGGAWALHFIAMLAFMPGIAISFDLEETGWSVFIAIIGAFAGFGIGLSRLPVYVRTVGAGFLLTASIEGMHELGVSAMRLQGRIELDHQQVALSIVTSGLFACCAVYAMSRLHSFSQHLRLTLLLSFSICLLHFTGMSAITFHLGLGPRDQAGLVASANLAVAVGAVTSALLLISLSLSITDRHLSDRAAREAMRLREIAHHDPLTGLANRALLEIELNQTLEQAREDGLTAAVFCLDLDRFKLINDLHRPRGETLGRRRPSWWRRIRRRYT
jgi:NO-binding membrane sensor protein with MHYT domain